MLGDAFLESIEVSMTCFLEGVDRLQKSKRYALDRFQSFSVSQLKFLITEITLRDKSAGVSGEHLAECFQTKNHEA